MNLKSIALVIVVGILALAIWLFFTANPSSAPVSLSPATPTLEPPAQNEADDGADWPELAGLATFDNQAKLLAFALPAHRFSPGNSIEVTLYWQTQTVTDPHNLFLHLVDANSQLIVSADAPLTNRDCAVESQFSLGIVATCDALLLPESLAAGEYQLLTGLYNPVTGQRLATVTGDSAILLTPIQVGTSGLISATTPPPACQVTVPNGSTPPGEQPSPDHHGNGQLWTGLWPNGTVVFEPGGPGTISPDGSLSMKWWWWRGVAGQLTIEGRRLDAPASPLQADIPDGYGDIGFQAVDLTFSGEGCWEVTGKVGEAALTFVVFVVKER